MSYKEILVARQPGVGKDGSKELTARKQRKGNLPSTKKSTKGTKGKQHQESITMLHQEGNPKKSIFLS